MNLNEKKCIPCSGGVPSLPEDQIDEFKQKIDPSWLLTHDKTRLRREFKFKDFASAMNLAKIIGAMADEQWHHPEIHLGFGHLEIEVWTHKINGLVESDFIFAAKTDTIYSEFMRTLNK